MSAKNNVIQKKDEVKCEIKVFSNERKNDLKDFDCGDTILNRSLINGNIRDLVKQSIITCRLLIESQTSKIIGFYTLKNHSFAHGEFIFTGKHKSFPVTKLDMLAVDKSYQGQGFGLKLLRQAFFNVAEASKHVGSNGIYLEAVADKVDFYRRLGFEAISDATTHPNGILLVPMFLPMHKVKAAISHQKD